MLVTESQTPEPCANGRGGQPRAEAEWKLLWSIIKADYNQPCFNAPAQGWSDFAWFSKIVTQALEDWTEPNCLGLNPGPSTKLKKKKKVYKFFQIPLFKRLSLILPAPP